MWVEDVHAARRTLARGEGHRAELRGYGGAGRKMLRSPWRDRDGATARDGPVTGDVWRIRHDDTCAAASVDAEGRCRCRCEHCGTIVSIAVAPARPDVPLTENNMQR